MKYFYDLEFLEDGKTIDLISIGIVAEDGREYYAVNWNADWDRVVRHEWLRANVWPSLPLKREPEGPWIRESIDGQHRDVKRHGIIAEEVRDFLRPNPDDYRHTELWAWCGAYDHVATYQLWGPMSKVHGTGLPFYTHDLKSVHDLFLNEEQRETLRNLPMAGDAHNALDDARQLRDRYDYVFSVVDRIPSLS
jgi:hypothetical protein